MMTDELDLLIKDGRLRGRGDETVDIGIHEGKIQAIDGKLSGSAKQTIESQ